MVVRFKLDRCGVKLSLRQWSKMGMANRASLRADAIQARDRSLQNCRGASGEDAVLKPSSGCRFDPKHAFAWATSRVPAEIIRQAMDLAALAIAAMLERATPQRFALLKLARSDHDNQLRASDARDATDRGLESTRRASIKKARHKPGPGRHRRLTLMLRAAAKSKSTHLQHAIRRAGSLSSPQAKGHAARRRANESFEISRSGRTSLEFTTQ